MEEMDEKYEGLLQAARQGDAEAQFQLGYGHHYGDGMVQDFEAAVKWYRMAVEQEWVPAYFHLGECYYFGTGVQKDSEKAKMYYQMAAQYDYMPAIDALHYDIHYEFGAEGLDVDD